MDAGTDGERGGLSSEYLVPMGEGAAACSVGGYRISRPGTERFGGLSPSGKSADVSEFAHGRTLVFLVR